MKYLYLLGITACSSLFAAEAEEETTVQLTSGIEPLETTDLFSMDQGEIVVIDDPPYFEAKKGLVYPLIFGQYEMVTGGVGAGLRTRTKFIGFEGNATYIIPSFIKVSANAFLRLSNQPDRGIYLGGGYGIVAIYGHSIYGHSIFGFPYIPLFIGYEGEKFFGDIGIDALIDHIDSPFLSGRYGVRF